MKIQHIKKLEENKQNYVTYLAELSIALECDPIWLGTGKPRESRPITELDESRLTLAWEALQTIIAEHEIELDVVQQVRLALAVYSDLAGGGKAPLEAARKALTRSLVERLRQADA